MQPWHVHTSNYVSGRRHVLCSCGHAHEFPWISMNFLDASETPMASKSTIPRTMGRLESSNHPCNLLTKNTSVLDLFIYKNGNGFTRHKLVWQEKHLGVSIYCLLIKSVESQSSAVRTTKLPLIFVPPGASTEAYAKNPNFACHDFIYDYHWFILILRFLGLFCCVKRAAPERRETDICVALVGLLGLTSPDCGHQWA